VEKNVTPSAFIVVQCYEHTAQEEEISMMRAVLKIPYLNVYFYLLIIAPLN
jgi:hypothetical protein